MRDLKNRNISKRRNRSAAQKCLVFVLLIGFCFCTVNAQVGLHIENRSGFSSQPIKTTPFIDKLAILSTFSPNKTSSFFSLKSAYTPTVQQPNFSSCHELGFFCKLDLKLDKRMSLPLRFRLGNLEYVNRLEGYWD